MAYYRHTKKTTMNKNLGILLQGLEEGTSDIGDVINAVETAEDFAQCGESINPGDSYWILLYNELSDLYMEFFEEYC